MTKIIKQRLIQGFAIAFIIFMIFGSLVGSLMVL